MRDVLFEDTIPITNVPLSQWKNYFRVRVLSSIFFALNTSALRDLVMFGAHA